MRDWDLFRSCFDDEVRVEISYEKSGARTWKGEDWVEAVRSSVTGYVSTQHITCNHYIEIDGDNATCRADMQATHYLPNDLGDPLRVIGGYYEFSLLRRDGEWRVNAYRLNITWATGNWHLRELAKERMSQKEA